MSAVLSEAETKFFASGGNEVDPSLAAAAPEDPSSPPPAEPPAAAAPTPAAAPAPAVAAQAAPAAPATQPAAAPEPAQQVPLAALHEERRRRAEAEQTARQLQQQFEQLQTAIRQAQESQAPQAPDPEQDPMGYLAFQNQQLQRQVAEMGQWRQQTEQQRQQAAQYQNFVAQVQQSENAFRAATPDYDESVQFAMKLEDARLKAFYPDPAERLRVLQMEAANVLSQALQRGMDPAAALYQAAKEIRAAVGVGTPAPAAGAAPVAPVPAAPAQVADAAEKIRKGLAQQTNLAAGGTTPPAEMTPEALASISDPAEFNKQWSKVFKRR